MYEPVSRYELIEGYDRQPSKEETLYQNEVKMQFQYCDSNIELFSIATHLVIALPTLRLQSCRSLSLCFNFCISFVDWSMASFLYCFPYSYRSSNYCNSNSCRSFTLLKAIAKSKSTHIAIALKSEKEQ